MDTIKRSECVIQSAKFQRQGSVYKRQVLVLNPVLPNGKIFFHDGTTLLAIERVNVCY